MKFNHNKKRNTAFLYEVLIVELSKASMSNSLKKRARIIELLKEHFSKNSILRKELEIYRSFEDISDLDSEMMKGLIRESKDQFTSLNRKSIFNRQSILIAEINKSFGPSVWTNFVRDYKRIATINQVVSKDLAPKKQIMIEKKLVDLLQEPIIQKKQLPNVNNLAMKTFIERFNNQYGESLNENQKTLLGKYIMSSNTDGIEFKMYFYEEVDRLRGVIMSSIEEGAASSANKLQKIVDKMNNYNSRPMDRNLISEVVKIQSLVREMNQ
jgi:hypothetical protein